MYLSVSCSTPSLVVNLICFDLTFSVFLSRFVQSIAANYGMHWMTLFLMNNYSVAHPDYLKPGDLASRAHLAYCVTVFLWIDWALLGRDTVVSWEAIYCPGWGYSLFYSYSFWHHLAGLVIMNFSHNWTFLFIHGIKFFEFRFCGVNNVDLLLHTNGKSECNWPYLSGNSGVKSRCFGRKLGHVSWSGQPLGTNWRICVKQAGISLGASAVLHWISYIILCVQYTKCQKEDIV